MVTATTSPQHPGRAVAAAVVMNPTFGALYTWSVFIAPLEAALDAPRADISSIFAFSIASFTIGMWGMPRLYRLAPVAFLLAGCVGLIALGLAFSATASQVWHLVFGYGLLFGLGCGASYSVTLQLITLALPHRGGLANGVGIGSFALGSILFTVVFAEMVANFGAFGTFAAMAVLLATVGIIGAALAAASRISLPDGRTPLDAAARASARRLFPLFWVGFLFGAFAGVMSIGHAAGIVANYGGTAALAVIGTVAINIGNAGGRFTAGILSDYLAPGRIAAFSHLTALAGFIILLALPTPATAVLALALEGLAYGLASGSYPSALVLYFGAERYGRYMGLLITSYGVAGLAGPWLAGWLYDVSGGYAYAAWIGGFAAVAGFLVTLRIPPPTRAR